MEKKEQGRRSEGIESTLHQKCDIALSRGLSLQDSSPSISNACFWFIYFSGIWLCRVFVAFCSGFLWVAVSGGYSSLRCVVFSLQWPLLWQSTGSRRVGSAVAAHVLSHTSACGVFWDQGLNPCPLHWQANSYPLLHQVSPLKCMFLSIHFSGW